MTAPPVAISRRRSCTRPATATRRITSAANRAGAGLEEDGAVYAVCNEHDGQHSLRKYD